MIKGDKMNIEEFLTLAADRNIDKLLKTGDDDFSFAIPGLSRFRVSAYKQRGSLAAVIRVIAFRLPDSKEIGIPDQVMRLSELNKGLVLVTGSAGSESQRHLPVWWKRSMRRKKIISLH